MVSTSLIGRMGNQMFQIAATIAYALRNGLEYHIPAHTQNDKVWEPVFTHLENQNWDSTLPSITIKERGHQYQEIGKFQTPIEINIIIDGYRQSIKYFEDYLPEIRKAFVFDYEVKKEKTCFIHWRFGDYRFYPLKHPICPSTYIIDAINIMGRKGVKNFIFFSDEPSECDKFIYQYFSESILPNFYVSKGKNELQDFQLMLECGYGIISNSTYSLMAAILSESPNKIVISPDESNWFGIENKHLSVEDLIPKDYIRIKY